MQSFTDIELLTLPLKFLHQINTSYYECYQQIFGNTNKRYWRTRSLKQRAIEFCEKALKNHCHKQKFNFKSLDLDEIDNLPNSEIFHSSYSLDGSLSNSAQNSDGDGGGDKYHNHDSSEANDSEGAAGHDDDENGGGRREGHSWMSSSKKSKNCRNVIDMVDGDKVFDE